MDIRDSLQVRAAVASDAKKLARVHVDAWRETYSGVLANEYFLLGAFERRVRFWTGYLAQDPRPGKVVVGERDGVLVGFANAGEARGQDAEHGFAPARPLHLFAIYVLAFAHGTGLGQSLLDAVVGDDRAFMMLVRLSSGVPR
jgi:GNAT superfamily N-acetyltransferase